MLKKNHNTKVCALDKHNFHIYNVEVLKIQLSRILWCLIHLLHAILREMTLCSYLTKISNVILWKVDNNFKQLIKSIGYFKEQKVVGYELLGKCS